MRALLSAAVLTATFLTAVTGVRAATQKETAIRGMFPISQQLKIAIVGDSTLRTLVTDNSPVPCGAPPFPVPCGYTSGSLDAYPNILGQRNTVFDVANLGTQTQGQHTIAEVLSVQVPNLPADADLAIVDIDASAAYSANPGSTIADFDALLHAISARAPKARLLVLGARNVHGVNPATTAIWNFNEKRVAVAAGARFADMDAQFPVRDFADFPDSQHPSTSGSQQIAAFLATVLYGGAPAASSDRLTSRESSVKAVVPKNSLPPLPPRSKRIKIAIIGSSMELQTIMPGSPVPCGSLLNAPPCTYETLPLPAPVSYPNLLGLLANAEIINHAVGGAQSADANSYGKIPNMLGDQVPKIPVDADVVVIDIGTMDVAVSLPTDAILNRADEIAAAIRARAPHAHMIFMNIHDFATEIKTRVNAWDAHEAKVAEKYDAALVDMHTLFPASDYADYPDDGHPSPLGAMKVALILSAVIDKMRAP